MIRQLPWILWTLIIAVLSFTPGDQFPAYQFELVSIDTLAHLFMYFILAFLQLDGFKSFSIARKNKMNLSDMNLYGWVILIGIGFGLMVELIQGNYIFRRYFDIYDLVANLFGTIFGVIMFRLTGIKFIKN